jgi:OPA family glycerol-3-phosphate transporter-like MFS transporter
LGVAFYFIARDRPSDVGLPDYVEEDAVSATPESIDPALLKGLGPYKLLLSNTRFLMACHVKGLENIVRYGLTTWVPIYYFEEGGLSIESTVLLTILLPVGYLIAPPAAGIFSDRYLGSRRQPMIFFSCSVSAVVLVGVAFAPPVNITIGAILMFVGGLSMGLSSINSVAVDIAGRHMSGTALGIMSAHGYAYAGAQALIFAAVLDMAGSPWPIVFLAMAATRVLSALLISRVNV